MPKVQRNRTLFADGRLDMMLLSERLYFQAIQIKRCSARIVLWPAHVSRFLFGAAERA